MNPIRIPGLALLVVSVLLGFPAQGLVGAQPAGSAGTAALAHDDIAKAPECPICGMDREKFAHSRVFVTYEDGTVYGTCSLHCAAIDLAVRLGLAPVSIEVGDYDGRHLIDAESASWVVGGSLPGVMTRRAKWAFETPEAAQAFIQQHGGESTDFDAVLKAAFEDMYEDNRMIRQRRKQMQRQKDGG